MSERPRPRMSRRAFAMLAGGAVMALGAACAPIQSPAAKPTEAPAKPAAPAATARPAEATPSTSSGQAKPAPQPTAAVKPTEAPAAAPAAARTGGRLTYVHLSDFLNFDGHRFATGNWPFFNLLYNSLVVLDKDMKPQPELAESWQFADDNRTLTLKLRKGVKFHNGREFNSEDVKRNLERIKDPKTAAHAGPLAEMVDTVETPDASTAVLRLNRVAPNVFDLLDLTYIIAPESVGEIAQKGVGTGPFKLAEFRPNDQSRFVRHADYFKSGLPKLDEVVVKVVSDPSSMVVFLESGSAEVIERVPPQDATRLRGAGLRVEEVWGGVVSDTLINTRQKPFDDRRVRQAMALAVNRERAIQVSFAGLGEPWCLPFPKTSIAYHADVAARCKYDLQEAKRLLDQTGVSGLEFEILVSTTTFPDSPSRGQIFQSDLAQIGIKTTIRDVEAADYRERTWGDQYQVAIHAFGRANRDPDTLFRVARAWWPKNNFAGFESPEYTRLVNEAGGTLDVEKRRALYKELSNLIVDEAFMITVTPNTTVFGSRPQVRGLTYNVEGLAVYENITVG